MYVPAVQSVQKNYWFKDQKRQIKEGSDTQDMLIKANEEGKRKRMTLNIRYWKAERCKLFCVVFNASLSIRDQNIWHCMIWCAVTFDVCNNIFKLDQQGVLTNLLPMGGGHKIM